MFGGLGGHAEWDWRGLHTCFHVNEAVRLRTKGGGGVMLIPTPQRCKHTLLKVSGRTAEWIADVATSVTGKYYASCCITAAGIEGSKVVVLLHRG